MSRLPAILSRLAPGAVRRRWYRRLGYATAAVVVLLAAVQVAGRLWLPQLAERRDDVAAYLSERSGYPVQIEALEAFWEGLNPGLVAHGFTVQPRRPGSPPVRLRELRLTLAWLPLLIGRTEINSLTIVQPNLTLERLESGQITLGGIDPVATEPGLDSDGFVRWLFAQRAISIEDGELHWLDRRAAEPDLALQHVNLDLRNSGERHRFVLRADFPESLCRGCGVTADVRGNPLVGETWSGQVQLRAIGLKPQALPQILRERVPSGLQGEYSAQLWSEWDRGVLRSVYGRLAVTGFVLPLPAARRPLNVQQAETDMEWRSRDAGWRLELRNLRLGLAGPAWWAGTLKLDRAVDATRLQLSHLNLTDTGAFLAALPGQEAANQWARTLAPTGSLDDLDVQLRHAEDMDLDYTVKAVVRDLAIKADQGLPGLRGISGKLRLRPNDGEFIVDARAGGLELPRVFRDVLPWRKASGHIRWTRFEHHWQVQAQDVRIQSEDGRLRGDLTLRLPDAKGGSPHLSLSAELRDGNGSRAARYYPSVLPPDVRRWLETSVRGGDVTQARVLFDGAISDFPFRDGSGRFEVSAHLRNGTLEYLAGWPLLTEIEADLLFRGPGMVITGQRGRIRDIAASQVTVRVEDMDPDQKPVLQVAGRAEGDVQDALDVLYRAPRPSDWSDFLPPGVKGEGRGRLVLDLAIPLADDALARVAGEYQLARASLHFPLTGLSLQALDGAVRFGRHGPIGASLKGQLLGGPFELSGESKAMRGNDELRLQGSGRVTAQGLSRVVGPALAGRLEGAAGWTGQLRVRGGIPEFRVDSDLRDLAIHLPAPLAKAPATPMRLVVHSTAASGDSHVLNLALGTQLSGRLAFRRIAEGWRFAKGRLGVGTGPVVLPEQDGLDLALKAEVFDGDAWMQLLREASGSGPPVWARHIARLHGEIGNLRLFEMPFGQVALSLSRWPSGWIGRVDGAIAAGDITIQPGTPAAVTLNLQRLQIPDEFFEATGLDFDPAEVPPLQVSSSELAVLGQSLGALKLRTSPAPQGLTIEELRIERPETQLSARGEWNAVAPGQASTRLEIEAKSSDLGATFSAFGYPDELAGGQLELTSRWSWPGAPTDFQVDRLDGNLSLAITDGRLLQIQQGAGQLFGILNLRSLVRLLTLDLKTLFGKGLAFDTIKGGFNVTRGNAQTNGLAIKGQNAAILMKGRVGLATRDLELEIDVLPQFKQELVITGLLLGSPAIGAAVLALQELFRKPIAETTRVHYAVSGPWSDPVVTQPPKRAVTPEATTEPE